MVRAAEIRDKSDVSDYVRKNVLTVAAADVQDKDGREFRLISINSASQQDDKIYEAVKGTLKPYEILVPNMLGGDAHAEENLTEFAERYGLEVKSIDVSRDFCPSCSETRRRQGSNTETETNKRSRGSRNVKSDKIRRNPR